MYKPPTKFSQNPRIDNLCHLGFERLKIDFLKKIKPKYEKGEEILFPTFDGRALKTVGDWMFYLGQFDPKTDIEDVRKVLERIQTPFRKYFENSVEYAYNPYLGEIGMWAYLITRPQRLGHLKWRGRVRDGHFASFSKIYEYDREKFPELKNIIQKKEIKWVDAEAIKL